MTRFTDSVFHILVEKSNKRLLLKVFTSGSDDMIKKLPELFKTRAKFTKRNPFNLKMKMREKMKTKELPLEKQESQVRVEGECIIYCSHRYNTQQTINNISYVRYAISYATYD